MRVSDLVPKVHLFVCANLRSADSPLGTGCGEHGEALFTALKAEVAARREYARVWVTKTACLGICPKRGAACARYPKQRIYTEAEAADAKTIYATLDDDGESK